MIGIEVELVERDMGNSEEDLIDERIDPLKDSEVEDLRASMVELRDELPVRHT